MSRFLRAQEHASFDAKQLNWLVRIEIMKYTLSIPVVLALLMLVGCKKSPTAQQLCNQASFAMQEDDHARAESLLRQATVLKPDHAEAWVGLGMSLVQQNQHKEARSAYERALALHAQRYATSQSENELRQQIFVLLLLNRKDDAEGLLAGGKQPSIDNLHELINSDFEKWKIKQQ